MTKEVYITYLVELIETGEYTREDIFTKFNEKWGKARSTFDRAFKKASDRHTARLKEINAEKDRIYKERHLNDVRSRIKTKAERVEQLQVQATKIVEEIEEGKTTETKWTGGAAQSFDRDMTTYEKMMARRTLKELNAEISKLMADYDPTPLVGSAIDKGPVEEVTERRIKEAKERAERERKEVPTAEDQIKAIEKEMLSVPAESQAPGKKRSGTGRNVISAEGKKPAKRTKGKNRF